MIYKRKESFRYQFNPPLSCSFSIVEIDGKSIRTGATEGELIDLSPQGFKLGSSLHIPILSKNVKLNVEFTVYRETIIANSEIVWSKKVAHVGYQYGLEFISVPVLPEVIIEKIKMFANQNNKTIKTI